MKLYTVGHGNHPQEDFAALLKAAGIAQLVDVRIAPGSRRNPHFARAELERWLPESGISYRWEKDLGGFRTTTAESPNHALRNESFRGYADYMHSPAFEAAFRTLADDAALKPTTVMCSESVWWRCHRRLISDYAVLVHGAEVVHVMPDGRTSAHAPTPEARLDGALVFYDLRPDMPLFQSGPDT